MNTDSKKEQTEQCTIPIVRRSFFRIEIDDQTRVIRKRLYIPSFLGTCYVLQRRVIWWRFVFWKNVAWNYTHILDENEIDGTGIVDSLMWSESNCA